MKFPSIILAVAITALHFGDTAHAENVSRFTGATFAGAPPPPGPAALVFNTNTRTRLEERVFTITVTGTAVAAGTVSVSLKDANEALFLNDTLLDTGRATATTPGGAFTIALTFECEDGEVIGAAGNRTGKGSRENPAKLFVTDGTVRIPFPRPGLPNFHWEMICKSRDTKDFLGINMIVNVLTLAPWNTLPRSMAIQNVQGMTRQASNILNGTIGTRLFLDPTNIRFGVSDQGIGPPVPGQPGIPPPVRNDGIVDWLSPFPQGAQEEFRRGVDLGVFQLRRIFPDKKGVVATVTNGFSENGVLDPAIGGAARPNKDRPVVYVFPTHPVIRGNAFRQGQTLAHEICHVFGLGPGHQIQGGTPFVPRADSTAHHPRDGGNLMHASLPGTLLTTAQNRVCRNGGKSSAGVTKSRVGDPVLFKIDTKHAAWDDERGDVTEESIDLVSGTLFAEGPLDILDIIISFGGRHAVGQVVNSKVEMFFDTDDDLATGFSLTPLSGIDKVLTISLAGQFPFAEPKGTMTAELLDVASGISTGLAPGIVERVQTLIDVRGTGAPSVVDAYDTITQSFFLPFLGELADQVPVDVIATDLNTGESDDASFVFEFNPPLGPLLEMSPLVGAPGDMVQVEGTNFLPSAPVTILVNDTEVVRTTTMADGSVSGSFIFPDLPSGDHFVTAMQATPDATAFDFSIFKVPVDHVLCYGVKTAKGTTQFEQIKGVRLKDQFEDGEFDVKKPVRLCNPADKNNEGIIDRDTHLEGYLITKVKGQHVRQTNILVENQFGELFVDTVKPDRLLVPTAKDLVDPLPAPSPGDHRVDHYLCYKVNVSEGTPKFQKGIQAFVVDQFNQPKLFDIRRPTRLCNPANKNGEGIKDPSAHLMCYQVKRVKDEPRHERVLGIHVNNQFGPGQLDTVQDEQQQELCVPSVKTLSSPPESQVDLAIAKTDSPDPVTLGNELIYSVKIENKGALTATGVQVTDTLPSTVDFVGASAGCELDRAVVTCALPDLASGAFDTLQIEVRPTLLGEIQNTSTVTANEPDADPANNEATTVTTVIDSQANQADLSITKEADKSAVKVGEKLFYSLSVKNNGPARATGVQVIDTLPPNVEFVGAGAGCKQVDSTVTCKFPDLSKGVTKTRKIKVKPTTPVELVNKATVTANEADPEPDNNTAITITGVNP